MPYRQVICLANSRKLRNRCVAGRDDATNEWIRPIGPGEDGALTITEISYADNTIPQILDIIKIPLGKGIPLIYQPENILIANKKWEKVGQYSLSKIDSLCDNPDDIWNFEKGRNDRISEEYLKEHNMASSLLLIEPSSLAINCRDITCRGMYGEYIKRKTRAIFQYRDVTYDFGVTDPCVEEKYKSKKEGLYSLKGKDAYLCISLGKPYRDYCYKFVATILFK